MSNATETNTSIQNVPGALDLLGRDGVKLGGLRLAESMNRSTESMLHQAQELLYAVEVRNGEVGGIYKTALEMYNADHGTSHQRWDAISNPSLPVAEAWVRTARRRSRES